MRQFALASGCAIPLIVLTYLSGATLYFSATSGLPFLPFLRTCRFTNLKFYRFSVPAGLHYCHFLIYLPTRFGSLPFYHSGILDACPFSIFSAPSGLVFYHICQFSAPFRFPGFPFFQFSALRFGSLSFYHFALHVGIHISIFPDLSRLLVYRFTDLESCGSIALPF